MAPSCRSASTRDYLRDQPPPCRPRPHPVSRRPRARRAREPRRGGGGEVHPNGKLAIVGSHSTNGVAAIHSELLRATTVGDRFGEGFRTPAACGTVVRGPGPAFESLPRRKPRAGRGACLVGRDLWRF